MNKVWKNDSRDIIDVSFDRSIRASQKHSENITFVLEVKCQYTPVYYKIHKRYICQVMLEMRALG